MPGDLGVGILRPAVQPDTRRQDLSACLRWSKLEVRQRPRGDEDRKARMTEFTRRYGMTQGMHNVYHVYNNYNTGSIP